MSDEEKKAIDYFKEKIKNKLPLYEETYIDGKPYRINILQLETNFTEEQANKTGILINLIEKQSKEIEELKAISEYREKIIKGLGLKTLPKTITGFRELIENNDKKWEDKIKANIEPKLKELERKMEEEYNKYGNSREYQDIVDAYNFLQSLLEKE